LARIEGAADGALFDSQGLWAIG